MCGRKSRIFLLLWVLSFLQLPSPCFADVRLTDREAQELLTEIEESKKDLQTVKAELEKSEQELSELQNLSELQKQQLKELKNTSDEQRKSLEQQLSETERKKKQAWTVSNFSMAGFTLIGVILVIILI